MSEIRTPPDRQPIDGLIEDLRQRGVTLWAEGEEVRLRGPLSSCARQLDELRARKAETLGRLRALGEVSHAGQDHAGPILPLAYDPGFEAIHPRAFGAMLEPERYTDHSSAFDRMIASTELHFWDPRDARYLDLSQPFDIENCPLAAEEAFPCLKAPVVQARLDDASDRARFINKVIWLRFSTLLHGEQGALNLAASLCTMLKDKGAQEFAANQTREEARHVAAFAGYIKSRWGRPAPCLPSLARFLTEIISSGDVTKKIIGMQVMVEGLAMGTLGSLYKTLLDPVGRRLVQLVMTDEAFHHKFGKLWADATMPSLSAADRRRLEAWTAHCLEAFVMKMDPPLELQVLRKDYGLDPLVVARQMQESAGENDPMETTLGSREIFRVLSQALLGAGLLSEASQQRYRAFLSAGDDGSEHLGYDDIVEDGLAFLRQVNQEAAIGRL